MFADPSPEAEQEFFRLCLPLYAYTRDPEHLSNLLTRPLKRMEVARHFFSGEAWTMDLRPELAKVVCPTLVINGDHDPIVPPVCSEEIVAGLVNADVTHIVGHASSHWLPADEPDLFEDSVRRFIVRWAVPEQ